MARGDRDRRFRLAVLPLNVREPLHLGDAPQLPASARYRSHTRAISTRGNKQSNDRRPISLDISAVCLRVCPSDHRDQRARIHGTCCVSGH